MNQGNKSSLCGSVIKKLNWNEGLWNKQVKRWKKKRVRYIYMISQQIECTKSELYLFCQLIAQTSIIKVEWIRYHPATNITVSGPLNSLYPVIQTIILISFEHYQNFDSRLSEKMEMLKQSLSIFSFILCSVIMTFIWRTSSSPIR